MPGDTAELPTSWGSGTRAAVHLLTYRMQPQSTRQGVQISSENLLLPEETEEVKYEPSHPHYLLHYTECELSASQFGTGAAQPRTVAEVFAGLSGMQIIGRDLPALHHTHTLPQESSQDY